MEFPAPTRRQANVIWFCLTALAGAAGLGLLGVVFWVVGLALRVLGPVLWPIAGGVVVAYILDPAVDALARRGVSRLRAVLLVFTVAAAVAAGAITSVLPGVLAEARDLAARVPELVRKGGDRMEQWIQRPHHSLPKSLTDRLINLARPHLAQTAVGDESATNSLGSGTNGLAAVQPLVATPPARDWLSGAFDSDALKSAGGWLGGAAGGVGRWLWSQLGRLPGWLAVLASLGLTPVYAFYLLTEKPAIVARWTDYLPLPESPLKREIVFVLRSVNDCLIVFVHGQVLVAICDGALYGLGFVLIGLPYGLLLGLFAMVATIVPFLGSMLVTAAALCISLVQFGEWRHLALVLVVVAVVQALEGFVIQPKIIGDRVGLHPMILLIAVMTGSTLMGGVLGAALAIPMAAAIRTLVQHYVRYGTAEDPLKDSISEPTPVKPGP